jgi:hypothetical protein
MPSQVRILHPAPVFAYILALWNNTAMASAEVPFIHIEPSDAMLSLFRRTVLSAHGRDPIDGKITVIIDPDQLSVNQETIKPGPTPGQRVAIDRWVTLTTDGEIFKDHEVEPLGKRLAREIKSSSPEPSEFDLDIEALQSVGYTKKEAYGIAIYMLFMRPGIAKACDMLVSYLENKASEAAFGLNDVDAFELAETIQITRDNFPQPK